MPLPDSPGTLGPDQVFKYAFLLPTQDVAPSITISSDSLQACLGPTPPPTKAPTPFQTPRPTPPRGHRPTPLLHSPPPSENADEIAYEQRIKQEVGAAQQKQAQDNGGAQAAAATTSPAAPSSHHSKSKVMVMMACSIILGAIIMVVV